jgi:hypothetical protein
MLSIDENKTAFSVLWFTIDTRTLVGIQNTGTQRVSHQVILLVDENKTVFSVWWFTIDTRTLVRASTKTV